MVEAEEEVVAELIEAVRAHVGALQRLFDLLDRMIAAIEPQEAPAER